MEYGVGAFGQLLLEHGEQPLLLGEVGVPADIPGHNLLGSHVVYGARYALPPAALNSVTSVPSFTHGRSAAKSRSSRFGGFAPVSPWYELYLRYGFGRRMAHFNPMRRITLSTLL